MPVGQVRLQRDLQRVALARAAGTASPACTSAPFGVEDADDAEARLDRLVEVERDAVGLPLQVGARRPGRCARASRGPAPLAGTASARTARERERERQRAARGSRRNGRASSPPSDALLGLVDERDAVLALPQAEADREDGGRRLALVDGRVADQPPAALVPVLARRVGGDVRPRALPQLAAAQPGDAPVERDPRLQAAAAGGAPASAAAASAARPRPGAPAARGSATRARRRRATTAATRPDRRRRSSSSRPRPPPARPGRASKPARTTVRRLDRRVERAPKQPQPASGAWRRPQSATSRGAAEEQRRGGLGPRHERRPATTSTPTASSAAATSAQAARSGARPSTSRARTVPLDVAARDVDGLREPAGGEEQPRPEREARRDRRQRSPAVNRTAPRSSDGSRRRKVLASPGRAGRLALDRPRGTRRRDR